jgi:hypothetical protein
VLLKGLAPLTLVIAIAGPASADVKSVASNGFEVASAATIAAPPDRVYAALGEVGRWWSPSHTFSRDAANLSIELRAGGCFCEKLRMAVRFSTSPSFTRRRGLDCGCAVRSARCRRRVLMARSAGH